MGLLTKKAKSETAAAVADVDDDQELVRQEANKRGMTPVDLEMQLGRFRGRALREQLEQLAADEAKQAEAQAEESKQRIQTLRSVREAQEAAVAAGIEEAAKLMVWLARACRAADPAGNAGLGRFRANIANGLVFRLREWAREANKGVPPDLTGIEV